MGRRPPREACALSISAGDLALSPIARASAISNRLRPEADRIPAACFASDFVHAGTPAASPARTDHRPPMWYGHDLHSRLAVTSAFDFVFLHDQHLDPAQVDEVWRVGADRLAGWRGVGQLH